MKNSILNLGKALNKAQQKTISGGYTNCETDADCQIGYKCYIYAEYTCQDPDFPIQY